MILIACNRSDYEYDLNALIKSFFPQRELHFLNEEKDIAEAELYLQIFIGENRASVILSDKAKNCEVKKNTELSGENEKNQFKLFFYDFLCEYTGQVLPWGNLTGIRPTKLAMQLLEDNVPEQDIFQRLYDEHRVSNEKIRLSIDIAKREQTILSLPGIAQGYSLYIGIPFCPTTCLYCSFTSYPIAKWEKRVWEYLYAMEKEMDFWSEQYKDKMLTTIYVGGGTPTTLNAEQLDYMITKLKEKFSFAHLLEFTVEAGRADSITEDKLKVLYRHGVTRISVNPQTMNDETLKLIGRKHSVSDVIDAFYLARQTGFSNINMDIILGLPGEEEKEVLHTVDKIMELSPDSLTIHSLAIKRASALNRLISERGIQRLCNTDETMKIAFDAAIKMGMKPYYLYRQKNMAGNYENVGYATEGKYGIYNILIMEEKQTIVAIGAGSITKIVLPDGRMERSDNVKDVSLYIEQIDELIGKKREFLDKNSENKLSFPKDACKIDI